jgi:hypothetical protein
MTKPIETPDGSVEVMDITPEFALDLLKRLHPNQRRLRRDHVEALTRAMNAGTFRWNGETYKLDSDLRVIDGQHRLAAIASSGVTHRHALIVTINDDTAISSIDQGRPRTLSDVMRTSGQKDLPAPVTSAILIDHCNFAGWRQLQREYQISIVEGFTLRDSLTKLYRIRQGRKLATAGSLAAAARVLRGNHDDGMAFFTSVFTMNPIIYGEQAPVVHLLYSWLNSPERSRRGAGTEDGIQEAAFKCLRAWNAWRRGERLSVLRYEAGVSFPAVAP